MYPNCGHFARVPADDPNADGNSHHNKKLDDLIRLAEMCVDQLQQNEEHYAEVSFVLQFTYVMCTYVEFDDVTYFFERLLLRIYHITYKYSYVT